MTYQLLLINQDTDAVLRINCELPELIAMAVNVSESFGALMDSAEVGDPEFVAGGIALGIGQSLTGFLTNETRYVNIPKCRVCNRGMETEEFSDPTSRGYCRDHRPEVMIEAFLLENLEAYLDSGDHYSRELMREDLIATFPAFANDIEDVIESVLTEHPEPSPRIITLRDGTLAQMSAGRDNREVVAGTVTNSNPTD